MGKKAKFFIVFSFLTILLLNTTESLAMPLGAVPPSTAGSCVKDEDCSDEKFCAPPTASAPATCYTKLDEGADCDRNRQCQTNNCKSKLCAPPAGTAPKTEWKPLAPKLQINIPTILPFTTEGIKQPDAQGNIYIPFLGQYIEGVYRWALVVVGTVCFILIIMGAFVYMTAGGNAQRVQQGRDRILQALLGLIVLLTSYTVLYLINPDLVRLKAIKTKVIERSVVPDYGSGDEGTYD